MKVLILSVGTGHGHNQVGSAIMNVLDKINHVQCEKIDTFRYISPLLGSSLSEGYLMATKYTPRFYGKFYRMAENRKSHDTSSILRAINTLLAAKITDFLEEYKPDVTICTHVFAAQVVTMLRKKGLTGLKIGVITDYTIHPYWEDTDIDYYITPNELLNVQAIKKGIPLAKVKPLGIPIYEKFSSKIDKIIARNIINIENNPTILVIGGSMGYGNITEIIQQLDLSPLDFQILCVCGNNTSLKDKIDLMHTNKKIYNYGFVDNIDILMDAADCIITKPGGLTVSESLAKGIPMLLVNPIPGQEERNLEFLVNNRAAIAVERNSAISSEVEEVLTDSEKRSYLLKAIKSISRPYAARNLSDLILRDTVHACVK